MSGSEIITRRRAWSAAEKVALLAEVAAAGGKVSVVARRHGMSESVLYNWRSARKAAAAAMSGAESMDFVPLGVFAGPSNGGPSMLMSPQAEHAPPSRASRAIAGVIEIALPNGARISVDGCVSEAALSRVLRAMRRAA
jgi:transposase